MIAHEYIRLPGVMRRFIDLLIKNEYEWKPDIRPYHAEAEDHITAFDPPKKASNNRERENDQHDSNEEDKSVNRV
jgi:hypothetical protein